MINTFSRHYRRKYGMPVGKVVLDGGVICPNRARGGCIYCRPASYTPLYLDREAAIMDQLSRGRKVLQRRKIAAVFGYFQQETITILPLEELHPILVSVLTSPGVLGIIISTRPDYLEDELLDLLAQLARRYGKEILLELGLQTIHEASLQLLNRNHDFSAYVEAAAKIRRRAGLQLGTHLIFGIPGESGQDMLQTVQTVCALGVNVLKLHHLQIIDGTPLQRFHARKPVSVFTAEQYLDLLAGLLPHIPAEVVLHRLWSTSHPAMLVAPRWDLMPHQLSDRLQNLLLKRNLWQGKYCCRQHLPEGGARHVRQKSLLPGAKFES